VVLIGLIIAPLVPTYPIFGGLTLAFLLLLLPATQGAVDLVNNTITVVFKAYALPKLDFSKGVPQAFTTLVVVPTLLMKEKQVRELFDELEVRYLANQDRNIHFGLLTDLPDSVTRPRQNDTDPLVDLAIQLTDELNERYAGAGAGSFFLLHRHRIFNARQGVWMGWERKRGKLLDLNKLLKGQFDPFPVKAGDLTALTHAQYVITLDSDTQLPRGTAHTMIGAMAHPLNRAIIDPDLRIVTEGYGILQPRVGVSVQSASRSRLASIYSGQTGFDIYTRAISDAYQDLYGEGMFTGKGIYEINALHAVLDRRFPRNSLLSHDLIEGSYARVGLTTDIEVIDDYPSHYSAYTRRKHRWLRGDWQIAQWLFSKVPDESGRYVRNPIATISRWKIFDNLRRSLVEVFTFLLLLAGWLGLPGGALYWTVVTLFLMFVPTLVQLVFSVGRAYVTKLPGAVRDAVSGFGQGTFIALLTLVYLPHQTLLALDAIIRSMVRSFITGQRLLEWETAAEAEASGTQRTPVDRYLALSPLVAVVVGVLIFLRHPESLLVALPILLLWAFAGAITAWLNNSPQQTKPKLTPEEDIFLRQLALKTWRFFYQFGGESHNYLIPDNVEEDGLFEAARVSPTNFGLLLNARQAASTFGYLTVPEFITLTERSLETYDRLEKYRGHIYNWYDTRTLIPIRPMTISSVDSGNLAASFYTLRSGCRGMVREPLLDPGLFAGIRDHWQLLIGLPDAPAGLKALAPPAAEAEADAWIAWALDTADSPELASGSVPAEGEAAWWLAETQQRIHALVVVLRDYMPWLLPQFAPLFALPQLQGLRDAAITVQIGAAGGLAADLDARIARASTSLAADSPEVMLAEELRLALAPARERLKRLVSGLQDLAAEAMRFATEMDFGFLMDKSRLLLSIGYEIERQHLHQACYDLLSSEARIAAFITVAKGEAPQQSWFKLGRIHTMAYGHAVLISWTGTMFEYLMPSLWMRSYPETLMSRTLSGVVAIQRAFGKEYGIPWGISESGWAGIDDHGHYHYQAFGIPQIALKWDAVAGPVVSPYSTCLALGIDAVESLRNLKRMAKMGWTGAYGFYEAADYQESTKTPKLVREWMAHHQGMSLLAVLNLLYDNIVQDWFHANAHLEATQLLLHEKPMHKAALKAEFQAAQPRKKAS
jgi:cyclic beta-1,2-glucan synthetase